MVLMIMLLIVCSIILFTSYKYEMHSITLVLVYVTFVFLIDIYIQCTCSNDRKIIAFSGRVILWMLIALWMRWLFICICTSSLDRSQEVKQQRGMGDSA